MRNRNKLRFIVNGDLLMLFCLEKLQSYIIMKKKASV